MAEAEAEAYLASLSDAAAERLRAANAPALATLQSYLARDRAVAFLGAGASAPLYPLWSSVIDELLEHARAHGLGHDANITCRGLAASMPAAIVEVVRRELGEARYQAALRDTFRVRRDPATGRTWTDVQELVCRCRFRGVVTTNYDPGIADARVRVRPDAISTGFTSWTDDTALDRWRTGDVLDEETLPLLFAHGHHNQPDQIVLATTEYRRAYAGKIGRVLERLVDAEHLVWIGFSFADQRVAAILREVAERTGVRHSPGAAPRHVAIMPWDVGRAPDPGTLAKLTEIEYGADLVLYPVADGDHGALPLLLSDLVDDRHPAPAPLPVAPPPIPLPVRPTGEHGPAPSVRPAVVTRWVPGVERARGFVGRDEELARLDRWAADPEVRLIGVTAWGGAGKTALVTRWLEDAEAVARRAGACGVFGWDFYADPSADHWAEALLAWAREAWPTTATDADPGRSVAAAVLELVGRVPMILVLDGLEVTQEGPDRDTFGRLLDGMLREVLTTLCRREHSSLVVLTSRFPFADLIDFDGTSARMLEVPPFTESEGAAVLAGGAAAGLTEDRRRDLVREVDGHALAVTAMAALLAVDPETSARDVHAVLVGSGDTRSRVNRVLDFYSRRLAEADRYLVAAVALFARPVTVPEILAVTTHDVFAGRLHGWTPTHVRDAVRCRLTGLLTYHADGRVSAHPLVRETFRPLALGAAEIAVDTSLAGMPSGEVTQRDQVVRLVEAVELLLEAGEWSAADSLYRSRTARARLYRMPAIRLGQRAALAFVATTERRERTRALGSRFLGFYLNGAGQYSLRLGDLASARFYLEAGIALDREADDRRNLRNGLRFLAECLLRAGRVRAAAVAAEQALVDGSGDERPGLGHAARAFVADIAGDVATAESHYLRADLAEHARNRRRDHLLHEVGARWASLLARTGRRTVARRLLERNLEVCRNRAWNDGDANCRTVLARLDLGDDRLAQAADHLAAALRVLREGDVLVGLADALVVAGALARRRGDLDGAADHVAEALGIAVPRSLNLTRAEGLAVRARVAADRYVATRKASHLEAGRDAADAALRLATGSDPLPWSELEALEARQYLDDVAGTSSGWYAQRATRLRAELVPPNLDPDPPATVEARVAAQDDDGAR